VKIALDLTNTHEPTPVPSGVKYNLAIISATQKVSSNNKPQIEVFISIVDHPEAPDIRHYISLVQAEDDAKTANFKQLFLVRFLAAFKIPFDATGFDVDDFEGATANLELSLEVANNGNSYNRLVLPNVTATVEGNTNMVPPKR
jgi:hypothetical protein